MFCRKARMRSPDFRATISLSSRDCGACTLFRAAAAWMLPVGAARSDQDPAMYRSTRSQHSHTIAPTADDV